MALVYGGCLLSVLLKIEVNILGGYMFKEFSSDSRDEEEELHDHTSIEKQYLSSVQYFMETGDCFVTRSCENIIPYAYIFLQDVYFANASHLTIFVILIRKWQSAAANLYRMHTNFRVIIFANVC